MLIIKDRVLVENVWKYDFSKTALSNDTQSIISYQLWQTLTPSERAEVEAIALFPEDDIEFKDIDFSELKLIAVVFPNFHEGRGFTQASLLREYQYKGELRAVGVHRDNLSLLERCGFNAFDLAENQDVHKALEAFYEINVALAS